MAYKALYRTYRPTTFAQVAGQESIIKTLQNSLTTKKTSHAYIFSGPRGIGKTTVARIFAKALNCEEAPTSEPCNVCANCLAITNNQTTDIIELDAASNNGVDEIRQILEKVNFLPSHFKYKVYIIDEVHMLSTSAFNALLKTLEEPPSHVVFILATTEPHKIPMTILSRCQRFDFKSLTVSEIKGKLAEVASLENIDIDDEALEGIAEVAEGGMRDALSILDQVIVYSDGKIAIEDVNSVTGRISNQKLIELIESFSNKKAIDSIRIVDDLLSMGKEVSRLTGGLIQFCRDILLYQNTKGEAQHKNIYDNANFQNLVKKLSKSELFFYIDVLMDIQNKIRFTNSPKIYLEVGIMKIVNAGIEDVGLSNKIMELEEKIKNVNVANPGIPPENAEKINMLELRLNKIVAELTKLDLSAFRDSVSAKLDLNQSAEEKLSRSVAELGNKMSELEQRLTTPPTEENAGRMDKFEQDLAGLAARQNTVNDNQVKDLQLKILDLENRINAFNDRPASGVSEEIQTDTRAALGELQELKENYLNVISLIQKIQGNIVNNEQFQALEKTANEAMGNIQEYSSAINSHNALLKTQGDDLLKLGKYVEVFRQQIAKIMEKLDEIEGNLQIFRVQGTTDMTPFKDLEPSVKAEAPSSAMGKDTGIHTESPVRANNTMTEDISSVYDVKIIEEILHSSRDADAREEKNRIVGIWPTLSDKVSGNLISIAKLLSDGVIAAVGNLKMIIAYPNATVCNHIMKPRHHEDARTVLKMTLGKEYDFIALPENTWQEKRSEYRGQYNMGVRFPKLSPIQNSELKSINLENDNFSFSNSRSVQKAEELFGKKLVKVED